MYIINKLRSQIFVSLTNKIRVGLQGLCSLYWKQLSYKLLYTSCILSLVYQIWHNLTTSQAQKSYCLQCSFTLCLLNSRKCKLQKHFCSYVVPKWCQHIHGTCSFQVCPAFGYLCWLWEQKGLWISAANTASFLAAAPMGVTLFLTTPGCLWPIGNQSSWGKHWGNGSIKTQITQKTQNMLVSCSRVVKEVNVKQLYTDKMNGQPVEEVRIQALQNIQPFPF